MCFWGCAIVRSTQSLLSRPVALMSIGLFAICWTVEMPASTEIGLHHHIAGAYLLRYAQEATWREDNRRTSNGDQVARLTGLALSRKPSVDFSGYWQRHVAA